MTLFDAAADDVPVDFAMESRFVIVLRLATVEVVDDGGVADEVTDAWCDVDGDTTMLLE